MILDGCTTLIFRFPGQQSGPRIWFGKNFCAVWVVSFLGYDLGYFDEKAKKSRTRSRSVRHKSVTYVSGIKCYPCLQYGPMDRAFRFYSILDFTEYCKLLTVYCIPNLKGADRGIDLGLVPSTPAARFVSLRVQLRPSWPNCRSPNGRRGFASPRIRSKTKKPAAALGLRLVFCLVRTEGFEPPANRFEAGYSIQLSYVRVVLIF